jgi:hypothetical protein
VAQAVEPPLPLLQGFAPLLKAQMEEVLFEVLLSAVA